MLNSSQDLLAKQDWIELAKDFDAQFNKLSALIATPITEDTGIEEDDKAVAKQLLDSIIESCDGVKKQLELIELGQNSVPSASQLLTNLKRMIGMERMTPVRQFGTPQSSATPNSIIRPGKKATITTPMRGKLDFDAFPSTPTLDQLGLSGHAMAVVGHKLNMDSEATDSDAGMLIDTFSRRTFISSSTDMSTPMTTNNLSSCPDAADSDKSGWTHFTRTRFNEFICNVS